MTPSCELNMVLYSLRKNKNGTADPTTRSWVDSRLAWSHLPQFVNVTETVVNPENIWTPAGKRSREGGEAKEGRVGEMGRTAVAEC